MAAGLPGALVVGVPVCGVVGAADVGGGCLPPRHGGKGLAKGETLVLVIILVILLRLELLQIVPSR
jgi:hypothetical protein